MLRKLDVETLTDAMLNEADRAVVMGSAYPKGWRGRAERLAAEYERLLSIDEAEAIDHSAFHGITPVGD